MPSSNYLYRRLGPPSLHVSNAFICDDLDQEVYMLIAPNVLDNNRDGLQTYLFMDLNKLYGIGFPSFLNHH